VSAAENLDALEEFTRGPAAGKLRVAEEVWRRLGTMADSKFSGGALEKSIRGRGTMRNITTVRKLAALCEKEPPPPAPRKRAGRRRSG
jgi:hypothetical protein